MNLFTMSHDVWSLEFVLCEIAGELWRMIGPIFGSVNEDGCCGTEADCARALTGSFFRLSNGVRAKRNVEI